MEKKNNKRGDTFSFKKANNAYLKSLNNQIEDKDYKALVNEINQGENFLRQTARNETKTFDNNFINELKDGIDAIMKILANPRTFIKEEQELIQTELAKKVSTLSLRHFSTHTQYIREVDKDGNVLPSKILTIQTETDLAIYENRFIMTLIRRLIHFIQTRYDWIVEHKETYNSDLLLIHNATVIDGVTYEVDSRIKVSVPSEDDGNSERNNQLLKDLSEMKKNCSSFIHSPFMEQMRGAKEVSSPIHMTNMIVKHPDYHRAYELWCFLDQYEDLGISYDVKEVNQHFDDKYKEELSHYIANSILTIHSHMVNEKELPISKETTYTPQVIFTLEDVTYADSKFLYDAYPEAKESPAIPLPPTSEEVRENEERFKELLKKQRIKEKDISKAILEDKDRICYEEALKRLKQEEEQKKLLKELEDLRKENLELKEKLNNKKS